jgi:squalene synthase HpnC
MRDASTIDIAETASGKTHRDENFPVASVLIAPRHRAPILAFYNFVRAADDISDHPTLAPADKLALLDRLEAALLREGPDEPVARALREVLCERGLSAQHARDLLTAFRRDETQHRYKDWDDLIDYCRYSAMPVGRFVLDVHGEHPDETWGANDALCAALQIINHMQDCGKDYRDLDRVYFPLDTLEAHGASVEMLALPAAPTALRAALRTLAGRTGDLLAQARPFADRIADARLAMEVGAIQSLAELLTRRLAVADPLSEKVHAGKAQFALVGALGATAALLRRLGPRELGRRKATGEAS